MMSEQRKVAIVTGSYRGVGLEIVKGLCRKFDGDVYITARTVQKAKTSAENLEKEGLKAKYHQLDIEDKDSIAAMVIFIKEKYGGLDILVNNAGTCDDQSKPIEETSVQCANVNFIGTLNVCSAFFPLLRSNARVVNVCSRMGLLNYLKDEKLRRQFADENATIDDIRRLVENYLEACKKGTWKKEGYPDRPYSLTKLALIAVTPILQKTIDKDTSRSGIVVSCFCPGYCRTEMTGNPLISLTPEEGAQTGIHLALLPVDYKGPRGAFWGESLTEPLNWHGYAVTQSWPIAKKWLCHRLTLGLL